MEDGSKQNSKKPPSTSRLANLLKNPDLLSMNVNYQSTREAFLDIAYQLDDFQKTMSLFEEAESRYIKVSDMDSINTNIQKLNTQLDQNTDDLSTEIRELRQYFSFQIKELNSKVDHNLTNVINELTKPLEAAPAPANSGENGVFDDNAYKSLKNEISNLKERFESLIMMISKPTQFDEEEEEAESNDVDTNKTLEGEENASTTHPTTPKSSGRAGTPVTPTSEKGESPSTTPITTDEKDNTSATNTNEENLDLDKNQSSTTSTVKIEKAIDESSSTPSLATAKQIAANLKSNNLNTFKRIIEMRLDDIKIQLNKLNDQINENEEKLNPLIPVVQRNTAENGVLRPELMKIKAEVMLLKGDIDIMKDTQANSSVDVMKAIKEHASKAQAPSVVDIEKPLTAMRHQIMQQFARMENAFNEQLKKLKAEIISVKNLVINGSNSKSSTQENENLNQSLITDDDQIKVADSFANEEPAEKVLIEQMQKEAEEERKKKQEELEQMTKEAQEAASLASSRAKEEREEEAEKLKKIEEEKFLQVVDSNETEKSSEKVENSNETLKKQAQVEKEVDESSKFHVNTYREVKNLPNQLIVSILADMPPRSQKVVHSDVNSDYFTDENESSNKNLTVNPTVAFEYARLGSPSDDELANVKKDIKNHQEIIERIVSQIAETSDQTKIEVPSLSSSSHENEETFSMSELNFLKEKSEVHQYSIDDLNLKVNKLISLSNFASLSDEEKKDKKILDEIIQHQNELKQLQTSNPSTNSTAIHPRQIVLSPVHFTPLNLEPLKVFKAKSGKGQTTSKSKKDKNETTKQKNPKKTRKQSLQPNKEAPAPALTSKPKDDTTVTIEVPPKPPMKDSKSSKIENKEKVQFSSQKVDQSKQTQDSKSESIKDNTTDTINNNNNIDNNNNDDNENEIETNEVDSETNDIPQNDDESHKSPKSSHRSSSHHSSHHSSRHSSSHHSPSHHSSSHHSSRSTKSNNETENDSNEKLKSKEEGNENDEQKNEETKQKIENNDDEEEEQKDKNEENFIDNEEEEEDGDQKLSQSSTEFFSPADSPVGGDSVIYETNQNNNNDSYYNENDEEEEEEEEGMDPILAEKLQQLSDLLNSHQEQIKNIREGLVEVRSNVQLVKMEIKDQRSTLLLPQLKEQNSEECIQRSKSSVDINQQIGDDNAIRAVRRRFDMQAREFENELYEIRKEIMEIRLEQSKAPQTVTERIIQVPQNGFQQNNVVVPSSPENNNDEDESKSKKKKKKENIFNDENKLMEIKPISLPNSSNNTPNKIPKLPIIDQQHYNNNNNNQQAFTPHINSQGFGPLMVTNTKQTRTQPTTPKQKKLPPILPTKSEKTTKQNENENEKDEVKIKDDSNFEEDQTDLSQKNKSDRIVNDGGDDDDDGFRPFFNNVVQQSINELNVLNAADFNVDEHILNLVVEVRTQLMLLIDKNTKRLNQIEAKIDTFVDKDYVQKFFQKMRAVITEMNSSVNAMKNALPDRVTKDDLQNIIEELYHNLTSDQETSGGTSNYRCLLCGRPKTAISGMIRDLKVAESLGQPTQATLMQSSNAGSRGTLIYGPDKQLYRGKGNFGKPTIAISDSKKQLPKMK